ncbi:hypothetical protein COEREDRAFT_79247 [Coemansia reversa NRRL 1564]|uniref:Uncharacterized protein n=1 Tax=Coemansia reversa (strain ATCC 12441 / NRRL 1564) TaxID=763665 RepID=A0A2G5BJW6_COERN|nr:hypothetical protein COEREDRAFT_79247 [Coemansia reversa NRRL 1564]|eukprot:PIA19300.1 hypothetical protein COEREDRAFT_79247 [Coemansia reversa NRRL 1564]
MLGPLDYVAQQAFKGKLSTHEREVLERELLHEWLWGIAGFGVGGLVGYSLARRNPSKLVKLGVYSFNALLMSNVTMCISGYSSVRMLNNEARYPGIVAAIRELDQGGIRLRSPDPNDPEKGPTKSDLRRPGLARLPPQKVAEDRGDPQSEFSSEFDDSESPDYRQQEGQQYQFGNHNLRLGQQFQYHEFGNPNPPVGQQHQQPHWGNSSTWDAIRGVDDKQTNSWDRLRNQNTQQNATTDRLKDAFGNSAQHEHLGNTSDNNNKNRPSGSVFGT